MTSLQRFRANLRNVIRRQVPQDAVVKKYDDAGVGDGSNVYLSGQDADATPSDIHQRPIRQYRLMATRRVSEEKINCH